MSACATVTQPLCACGMRLPAGFSTKGHFLYSVADILDIALVPGLLLEWQVLSTPHCTSSCALTVQSMVKITNVPKLLAQVPQIPEPGGALEGTYPGPTTPPFARGKMRQHQSPTYHTGLRGGGGGRSNTCKALGVWGTCGRSMALQAAPGQSSESCTAGKEILNHLPFPEQSRGPTETQT